nr:MAG TPA: hypothetical protein [Caudoviricetes sp.]
MSRREFFTKSAYIFCCLNRFFFCLIKDILNNYYSSG